MTLQQMVFDVQEAKPMGNAISSSTVRTLVCTTDFGQYTILNFRSSKDDGVKINVKINVRMRLF
jgi:hypothetical protein